MKNISALFLVLLIAPIAYSQTDILELIQKTDEGKEVFDSIYLDVTLSGDLNSSLVGSRLRTLSNAARSQRTELSAAGKANKKECRNTLRHLNARYHDFNERVASTGRILSGTRKLRARRATLLSRAEEERGHEVRFANMNAENRAGWRNFWKHVTGGAKAVNAIIARIATQVSFLHRKHRSSALIELPASYNNALNEISSDFEKINDKLGGFRPIVENLLEIVKSPKHLRLRNTRKSVRRLLAKLSEWFHDQTNVYSEENEHQEGLFDGVATLFQDAVSRSNGAIKHLVSLQKGSDHKIKWLEAHVRGSTHLSNMARELVDHKSNECRHINDLVHRGKLRYSRIIAAAGQVQEVIVDRFGALRGFFVQQN